MIWKFWFGLEKAMDISKHTAAEHLESEMPTFHPYPYQTCQLSLSSLPFHFQFFCLGNEMSNEQEIPPNNTMTLHTVLLNAACKFQ